MSICSDYSTISPLFFLCLACKVHIHTILSYQLDRGLDLDDKTVPQVCTASGTDMGAVGYTTFDFQYKWSPLYPTIYCMS